LPAASSSAALTSQTFAFVAMAQPSPFSLYSH
jgi:hypothetical protein